MKVSNNPNITQEQVEDVCKVGGFIAVVVLAFIFAGPIVGIGVLVGLSAFFQVSREGKEKQAAAKAMIELAKRSK